MLIDKCTRIIHMLFLAVTIWVSIIIFATSAKKYTLFSIAVVILIYIGYIFLRKKTGVLIKLSKFVKVEKYIFYILLLFAFVFMLIIPYPRGNSIPLRSDFGRFHIYFVKENRQFI